MLLSSIQLLMWFCRMFKPTRYVEEIQIEFPYIQVMILTWGMIQLAFRKPPDLVVTLTDELVLECKSRWSGLFSKKEREGQAEFTQAMRREAKIQSPISCCQVSNKLSSRPREMGGWDSDALPIVVDSGASRTLTPRKQDLYDAIPFKTRVKGLGQGAITHKGKIRWHVTDDSGKRVTIADDEAYYSPEAPYRLLSPQSWKKSQDKRRYASGETEGDMANLRMCDETYGYV